MSNHLQWKAATSGKRSLTSLPLPESRSLLDAPGWYRADVKAKASPGDPDGVLVVIARLDEVGPRWVVLAIGLAPDASSCAVERSPKMRQAGASHKHLPSVAAAGNSCLLAACTRADQHPVNATPSCLRNATDYCSASSAHDAGRWSTESQPQPANSAIVNRHSHPYTPTPIHTHTHTHTFAYFLKVFWSGRLLFFGCKLFSLRCTFDGCWSGLGVRFDSVQLVGIQDRTPT